MRVCGFNYTSQALDIVKLLLEHGAAEAINAANEVCWRYVVVVDAVACDCDMLYDTMSWYDMR